LFCHYPAERTIEMLRNRKHTLTIMKGIRYTVPVLLLALALVVLSTCGPAPAPTLTPVPPITTPTLVPPTPAPHPYPLSITDAMGREVTVHAEPEAIVSLAPSNTEILFALGLGDKVVGISDFCDYPEEAKAIERVGNYLEPNIEKIFALGPDLVLAITGLSEVMARLEELGIPVVILNPSDLEGILADIQLVGKATGAETEAEALVSEIRARIAVVTGKAAAVKEKPEVFCEIDATDPSKPWTTGPGSFMNAMIQLAGGTNVAADAGSPWVQLSAEEIITKDPKIIILADSKYGVTADSVRERPGWEVITAVKEGAIYDIDDDLISRPGPRIVDGLETVAKIIHPELFE
jgi:iron complex transport system substrate-binding protein